MRYLMVTVKQLRHLTAIVEQGNMHRAAESLHITQPALTRSCIFWPIPITRTGLIRSPLLEHNDHRFWFYPITFSGFPESVIRYQYG